MTHPLQRKMGIAAGVTALSLLTGLALVFSFNVSPVRADQDPATCNDNGAGISVGAFRADGTTSIGGTDTVVDGELIKYKATLSALGLPNCAFEGGTWTLTTPDGVVHNLGAVPRIGGTGVASLGSSLISYTVVHANEVGSVLTATTNYGGGISHATANDTTPGPVLQTSKQINVFHPGTIVVDKVTSPSGDPQSFTFTTTGTGYNGFNLTDQAAPNSQSLAPGTYSVAESALAGWNLASSTCSSSNQNSENPASISLQAGETVTCTFTNTKVGTLTIVKNTVGGDGQFSFTVGGGVSSSTPTLTTVSGTSSVVYNNLASSTYSVAENVPTGWDLTSATCSDGSSVSAIMVSAGESVTCTFTNTKRGHIVIVKDAVPNSAQDFSFTNNFGSSTPNPFALDDDADGTLSNTRDSVVMPGTYAVSEAAVSGWTQTSATCSDGSPIGAIAVAPGETVTCTFTNTLQSGHLIVQKTTLPSATSTIFSITATGTGTITGGGAGTTTDAVDKDYVVTPGTYSVSEDSLSTGWAQTGNTCTNVVVGAGETKTCVITNTYTPPPAEYCSPGYWKQSQHFDSWVGYSPNQTFQSVFGTNITIMWSSKGKPGPVSNPTLLQVLEANGGGVSSLARAAVGALLNASALDSSLTTAQVISIFNAAYPNGDFEAAKAQYTFPEMCPLN